MLVISSCLRLQRNVAGALRKVAEKVEGTVVGDCKLSNRMLRRSNAVTDLKIASAPLERNSSLSEGRYISKHKSFRAAKLQRIEASFVAERNCAKMEKLAV